MRSQTTTPEVNSSATTSEPSFLPMTSWTLRLVVGRIFASIRQQPLQILLAVVVVPFIWSRPADFVYERVFGEPTGASSKLLGALLLVADVVWSSVLSAGQLRLNHKISGMVEWISASWRLLHWCDRPRRRGRLGWTQVAGGPLRAQVRRANLACFEDGACFSALAFEQAI